MNLNENSHEVEKNTIARSEGEICDNILVATEVERLNVPAAIERLILE